MININKIYQWSRTNLFSNWYNSLLSLIIIFAFIKFIPPLLNWLFFDATFKDKEFEKNLYKNYENEVIFIYNEN